MKIQGEEFEKELAKVGSEEFEAALMAALEKTIDKVWNEKNKSADWSETDDLNGKLVPVKKLAEMFTFVMTSDLQHALAEEQRKAA